MSSYQGPVRISDFDTILVLISPFGIILGKATRRNGSQFIFKIDFLQICSSKSGGFQPHSRTLTIRVLKNDNTLRWIN